MRPPADVQTMDISPHPLPSLQMIVEWSLVLIFVLVRTLNTNPTKTVCEPAWIFIKESICLNQNYKPLSLTFPKYVFFFLFF